MPHGPLAGIARKATRLAARGVLLAAVLAALATPAVADAASVAYVDNGEVWLASLDGAKKARLATPVVNSDGDTEKWLDVAQSDGGRIVAVRNKPGRMSNFSWFKIWEPDGTSTVEGPLNAPGGWTSYIYPLGFDITADGKHLVYGYSNSGGCCPIPFGRGTYVRPATNSSLAPIDTGSQTHPSLFGSRIISLEDASSPKIINVQDAGGGNPYTNDFTPWLDTTDVPLDLEGIDVAANGRLAALGFETWDGGTQTVGEIGVLAIQGVDQAPAFPAAVNCFLPAAGIARDASLAPDAGTIAWKDDGGVKVAGSPSTTADPCVMGSAPVVLSPTGTNPSIGGADVAAFLPTPPATAPPAAGPGPGRGRAARAPRRDAPGEAHREGAGRLARRSRSRSRSAAPGRSPSRAPSRRGASGAAASRSSWRPGSGVARAAGTVTIRLRLNAVGRKRVRRLKGARLTLRIVQGSRSTTKVVRLR